MQNILLAVHKRISTISINKFGQVTNVVKWQWYAFNDILIDSTGSKSRSTGIIFLKHACFNCEVMIVLKTVLEEV